MVFQALSKMFNNKERVKKLLSELDKTTEVDYQAQLRQMLVDNKAATNKWLLASLSCGGCAVVVGLLSYYLMSMFSYSDRYLKILTNFDRGNLFYGIVCIGVISVCIHILGVTTTLANAYQPSNNSLRFIMHSFTAWLTGIVILSIIAFLVCLVIFYWFELIFRVS